VDRSSMGNRIQHEECRVLARDAGEHKATVSWLCREGQLAVSPLGRPSRSGQRCSDLSAPPTARSTSAHAASRADVLLPATGVSTSIRDHTRRPGSRPPACGGLDTSERRLGNVSWLNTATAFADIGRDPRLRCRRRGERNDSCRPPDTCHGHAVASGG
jgi:hypothetical protein